MKKSHSDNECGEGKWQPKKNASGSKFLSIATAVLALISTGLGIIITARTAALNQSAAVLEADLKTRQENRAEDIARRQITMLVYQEVKEATKAPQSDAGERQQRAATALVKALLKHDLELQQNLQAAILENSLSSVKATATENVFVVEQAISEKRIAERTNLEKPNEGRQADPQKQFDHYDFDVFWCEKSGTTAERAAQAINAALLAHTNGRVRTRILPIARNSDVGYRNNGLLVGLNPSEESMLSAIVKVADPATESALGAKSNFALKRSRQQTKWYISLFVCPNAYP
jgi:hypothetical protein